MTDFHSLLAEMDNEELMLDLFSQRVDPTPWEIVKVDIDREVVLFRTRNKENKERSFSRIQTLISEINKNTS